MCWAQSGSVNLTDTVALHGPGRTKSDLGIEWLDYIDEVMQCQFKPEMNQERQRTNVAGWILVRAKPMEPR